MQDRMEQVPSIEDGAEVGHLAWRKSRRSNPNGACVEFAPAGDGRIAMRDSKNPTGAVLFYPADEIADLVAGIKAGDFDDLLA